MTSQPEHTLAIDLGTFSSRAVLFDATGTLIESCQQPIQLNRIDASKVEQDGREIIDKIQHVVSDVLASSNARNLHISHAGLTTQRSSIIAWRPSNGFPISPVLSWQDTRASKWLKQYSPHTQFIQQRTGLRLTAHYGVSKMQWLLQHDLDVQSAIKQNDCVITPLASFILFHISDIQGIHIDIANASRTLLCNLYQRDWDEDLINLFKINLAILPECHPVQHPYGSIRGTDIHISAVNGDQTSAMLSNGQPDDQALRINLGTGAFALCPANDQQIHSQEFIDSGLLAGIANSNAISAGYYIEGTVNGAASAIQWLEKKLGIENILAELPYADPVHNEYLFINSVGKLGSPIWRDDIEPHFIDGMNQPADPPPQLALLAALESIIFLLQINIERIQHINKQLTRIDISGGLSNIDSIKQMLADLSGLPVYQYHDAEATARGIAWLAMPDTSSWQNLPVTRTFNPKANDPLAHRYQRFIGYLFTRA